MKSLKRIKLVLALLVGAFTTVAAAQTYPSGPIKLIVPYPAGGVTDIASRIVAKRLTDILKQPIVVDNRAGAGGTIGATAAARSPADGYTLFMGTNATHGTNPTTYPNIAYDAVKDFIPVMLVADTALLVVVNPSLPVNTIPELIALLKQPGSKINYATTGAGGGIHLAVEHFKMLTGTQMLHVPYKGSAPALADLMSNQVQVMFDNIASSLPLVKSGKLKAIAVTGSTRSPEIPQLPTVAESGVPGFELTNWVGIFVPAGTPAPIVEKLNAALNEAIKTPEVVESLRAAGLNPQGGTSAQFTARMNAEIRKWETVVKAIGYKPES